MPATGTKQALFWPGEVAIREGSACGRNKASFVLAGSGGDPGGNSLGQVKTSLILGGRKEFSDLYKSIAG